MNAPDCPFTSLAESDERKRDLLSKTLIIETPEAKVPFTGVEPEGLEVEIISLALVNAAAEAVDTKLK